MIYGNRLRYLRESEDYSLTDVAKFVGVDRRTMQHYESEYIIAPVSRLNDICNYFNISLDYIFKLTNTRNYRNSKKEISKEIAGKRLREYRTEHKLKQEIFAKSMEMSRSGISELETAKRYIETDKLYKFCQETKISADYLLGRTDEPKYLK